MPGILARYFARDESILTGPADVALWISDMTVAYHRKPVLWDVALSLPEGRLIAVVGPNGAGKSTLIKAILGLVPMASGGVSIYGKPYETQRRLVGYVPQRESVDWDFPVNAMDVVAMGFYRSIGWLRPVGRRHREKAVEELAKVGMADYADRQIGMLAVTVFSTCWWNTAWLNASAQVGGRFITAWHPTITTDRTLTSTAKIAKNVKRNEKRCTGESIAE